MKSYAPYENVAAQNYPAILITAGLNDPRVSYWEPAKWTAKLRAMKRGSQLLLLKTNLEAGHFGASGRYERLKEIMDDSFDSIVDYAKKHEVNNRTAAYMVALDRVAFAIKLRGIYA